MASRATAIAALCANLIVARKAGSRFHGHRLSHDPRAPFAHIVSTLPHMDPLVLAALPYSLDWRDVNGQDYMASVKNQHQPGPEYCGACWAFATTGMLNARFNVARGNAWPRTEVSVQVLISCSRDDGMGCDGSDVDSALKFIHTYGLPHDSCHAYQGQNLVCDAYNICQDCMAGYDPVCWARPKFPQFKVKEYGVMTPDGDLWAADPAEVQRAIDGMVLKMKAEIFKRGPIACDIACDGPPGGGEPTVPYRTNESGPTYGGIRGFCDDYTPFYNIAGPNFEPFVLHDTDFVCESRDWHECTDHDVVVAGWGQENGTPYWLIQNSWGEWWGEGGYFRVIMGINNLGIESQCYWGVPDLEGFDETKSGMNKFPAGNTSNWEPRFEEMKRFKARQSLHGRDGAQLSSPKEELVTVYA